MTNQVRDLLLQGRGIHQVSSLNDTCAGQFSAMSDPRADLWAARKGMLIDIHKFHITSFWVEGGSSLVATQHAVATAFTPGYL